MEAKDLEVCKERLAGGHLHGICIGPGTRPDRHAIVSAQGVGEGSQVDQFVLGDVQPTAVFGRVAKIYPFNIGTSFRRGKGFVERAFRVRVQVVAAIGLRVSL